MEYTGRSASGYYEHRILLSPKLSYGRQRRDAVRREGYSVMEMDGGFESWKERGLQIAK